MFKPIMTLPEKYQVGLEAKINLMTQMIDAHREAISKAQADLRAIKVALPFADKVMKDPQSRLSEAEMLVSQMSAIKRQVKQKMAILDEFLPELERLKALQAAEAEAEDEATVEESPEDQEIDEDLQ